MAGDRMSPRQEENPFEILCILSFSTISASVKLAIFRPLWDDDDCRRAVGQPADDEFHLCSLFPSEDEDD